MLLSPSEGESVGGEVKPRYETSGASCAQRAPTLGSDCTRCERGDECPDGRKPRNLRNSEIRVNHGVAGYHYWLGARNRRVP